MSALIGSDPLALQALEEGLIRGPLEDAGAQGDSKLDTQQRAAAIGEPVPIVFCRRVGDYGGVLISPAATEARFSNDASNAVTASYHLVLSEGRIGSIQVRDVFQRSCRVGSHSQTYDRRAGTWDPGNYVTAQAGYTMPECPYYCGTVGLYTGMSTLSFTVTVPNGVDQWNRQVHCFIRDGMEVPRLIEGSVGSSNNFADLYQWALVNCSRLPSAMIDTASLAAAATFLSANGLTCDINIADSSNLEDFATNLAPYFLLTQTRIAGRRGLRPLLPVNANGTINTGAIGWEFLFNEDYILPESFELTYIPLADRKPFTVQAIWRQQLTDDFGIIRTSEVRYEFEAADGPYEQHDLSQFCTRENHAVKVAAYIRARRKWVTHTARWVSRAQAFNTLLVPGDICRVRLERNVAGMTPGVHDFLYQVDRITQTSEGDVQIEATHLPIDEQGRSLVALDVAGTTGTGILLTSNKSGVGCDVNSSGDTTVPAETFRVGSAIGGGRVLLAHDGVPTPPGTLPPGGAPPDGSPADGPDETEDNPGDGLDSTPVQSVLEQDPDTCQISTLPACSSGHYVISELDENGDIIPGTETVYGSTLPINLDINFKHIVYICEDGDGSLAEITTESCEPTIDVDTLLLLHFNDANNTTTYTDSSDYAHFVRNTFLPNGNPTYTTTAVAKFGTGSLSHDGLWSLVQVNVGTIAAAGQDFTIDFWYYRRPPIVVNGVTVYMNDYQQIAANFVMGSSKIIQLYPSFFGYVQLYNNTDSETLILADDLTEMTGDGTWHHVAIERYQNIFYVYANGAVSAQTYSSSEAITGNFFYIGDYLDNTPAQGVPYNVNPTMYDEYRITKSAQYQGQSFTPPVGPY